MTAAITINIIVDHRLSSLVAPSNGYTVEEGYAEAVGEHDIGYTPRTDAGSMPKLSASLRHLLSGSALDSINDGKPVPVSRLVMDNCDDIITDCPVFASCEGRTINKHHFKG